MYESFCERLAACQLKQVHPPSIPVYRPCLAALLRVCRSICLSHIYIFMTFSYGFKQWAWTILWLQAVGVECKEELNRLGYS